MGKLALIGLAIGVASICEIYFTGNGLFLIPDIIGAAMFGWFGGQWLYKRKFGY